MIYNKIIVIVMTISKSNIITIVITIALFIAVSPVVKQNQNIS